MKRTRYRPSYRAHFFPIENGYKGQSWAKSRATINSLSPPGGTYTRALKHENLSALLFPIGGGAVITNFVCLVHGKQLRSCRDGQLF